VQAQGPLRVGVRRARADDKDAVLAFASTTWDGWDYIPEAWDEWLAATDGTLLVAETMTPDRDAEGGVVERGRVVALARVTMLAPAEAWLEGIRVDAALRGRDIGTNLQVAELAWAAAQGATVVRYTTGRDNEGSHRLGARHDFVRLADRRAYGPNQPSESPSGRPIRRPFGCSSPTRQRRSATGGPDWRTTRSSAPATASTNAAAWPSRS